MTTHWTDACPDSQGYYWIELKNMQRKIVHVDADGMVSIPGERRDGRLHVREMDVRWSEAIPQPGA